MSTTLLKFSSDNGISIGTSNPISNQIISTKPLNLQSSNLLNKKPEQALSGEAQLNFTDSENNIIGWIGQHFFSNEYQALSLFTQRTIDEIDYYNGFYLSVNSNGNPVVVMHNDDCKKAWQTALQPDVLFNTASLTQAFPITLSASAANYDHMRIYFSNTNVVSSIDVIKPNGKQADLFIGGTGNNGGIYWPQTTQISINGTQIVIAGSGNAYYMNTKTSTTTVRTTYLNSVIHIYRVEAW